MFSKLRKSMKWGLFTNPEDKTHETSYLLSAYIGMLEDALLWRNLWWSTFFIISVNIIFLVCIYRQINMLGFIFSLCATFVCIDTFEAWLKYKHRTSFLKQLASHDGAILTAFVKNILVCIRKKYTEFIYIREKNHTKAFLMVNIILSSIFLLGIYVNGYVIVYLFLMSTCFFQKIFPPIWKMVKKIQLHSESDAEFEGLIPDESEANIRLLNIEPEKTAVKDEIQSLDYWKPEEFPIEDSDSSDSSMISHVSTSNIQTLEKDIETSDSSEDEYMPKVEQEQLKSTLEEIQPAASWNSAAYNAFWNVTGAVANMIQTKQEEKRKRTPSADSSDGFEMIDKNDIN